MSDDKAHEAQQGRQQLQRRLYEAHKLYERTFFKRQGLSRDRARIDITVADLESGSAPAHVYKSVGKMFLMSPMDQIKEELKQKKSAIELEIASTMRQEQYFENTITTTEKDLRALGPQ
eukprot:m51a1_g6399 hypothetical protein (119) ;mRNA; f:219344-219901